MERTCIRDIQMRRYVCMDEGRLPERKVVSVMKKSTIALIAGAVLAVTLVGCGGKGSIEEQVATEMMTFDGTWEIPADTASTLSDEEAAIFDEVMEGFTGVGYEPITVIATQLVSGTNRAYLCKGTSVTPNGGTCWYVVTVYTSLSGESKILEIKELDIDNPLTTEEAASEVLGGWTVVKPAEGGISGEAAAAYDAATADLVGVSYTPIALLGTHIEGGPFYLVLAYGEPATANPQGSLYLIRVLSNTPTDGIDVNGTMIAQLDLTSYV